ncbi:type IV pilus biogenesis protein PilP [Pseudomonas sp. PIC25]|uniref:type IV pilus biogenesis protein PilP n=1 Tax=Pseudomonas sp. PIC25 TaxID=1958773 RepID=UPI0021157BE5|nr:type IV pilus biogenesis protein PilP [Pseudomonas sp. PIC25]
MRSLNDTMRALSLCTLCGLGWLSQPVQAAATVGELTDVQAETVLAEAKVRLAEAQAKLDGKTSISVPLALGAVPPRNVELPAPVVRTLYGSGGRMTASFLFPGGYEADAGAGQELPGGYRVESISLDKVLLSKDGKRFPVGFSNTAPSLPAENPSPGGMITPALPGAMPGQAFPPSLYSR